MNNYLFSAIKAPELTEEDRQRYAPVIALMRKAAGQSEVFTGKSILPINIAALQCSDDEGDSRSVASIVPFTCATKRSMSVSECGLPDLNHGAAARPQFSTVTGTPARKQASIALLARVLAVTTSTIWRYSSSVMKLLLRPFKKSSCNESARKDKGGK